MNIIEMNYYHFKSYGRISIRFNRAKIKNTEKGRNNRTGELQFARTTIRPKYKNINIK